MAQNNVYQMVTDRIISELEKGIIPWHKPWSGASLTDGGAVNYVTRKPYSMLNQMLLCRPGEYLSFKQITQLGGKVKKGAKSSTVVFFTMMQYTRPVTKVDAEGNKKTEDKVENVPVLRYYPVFHIEDCEGIESKIKPGEKPEPDILPIEAAEKVITEYVEREAGLTFQNNRPSSQAYYSPSRDEVVVPMLTQYQVAEEYYSTAFHELTHSTIPANRCNRKQENENAFFGNEDYSREELVAEIGSAMLCNSVGLSCDKAFKNSVAYIQGWLKGLKNDNKMIVWAASRAEKAARYILGEKVNA